TGVPGLAAIPLVGRLFTGESVDRERQDLMIALIPHIVRRPEFTAENLRGIMVGNQQTTHLSVGRRAPAPAEPPAAGPKKDEPPAETPAATPAPTPVAPPATTPAPTPSTPRAMPPATAPPARPHPAGPGLPPAPAPPEPAAPPATAPATPPTAAPSAAEPGKVTGSASIHFLPPVVNTTNGSSTTVALIIENAADVVSAPLTIQFDP